MDKWVLDFELFKIVKMPFWERQACRCAFILRLNCFKTVVLGSDDSPPLDDWNDENFHPIVHLFNRVRRDTFPITLTFTPSPRIFFLSIPLLTGKVETSTCQLTVLTTFLSPSTNL